jgi:hypothetical protein
MDIFHEIPLSGLSPANLITLNNALIRLSWWILKNIWNGCGPACLSCSSDRSGDIFNSNKKVS